MTFSINFQKYNLNFWKQFEGISKSYRKIQNYIEKFPGDGELFYVEEKDYIDKNFIIDYTSFYARCFDDIGRKVTRIHFFKSDEQKLKGLISKSGSNNDFYSIVNEINDDYIGFITKRPIFTNLNSQIGRFNGTIGRSILRRYPRDADSDTVRILNVYKKNKINLYGIPLNIDSLPFQEQDRAVSACATVSVWTALQALEDQYGISPPLAPSEITAMAYTPGSLIESTKFPNEGLNIHQITHIFYLLNYEAVHYKLDESMNDYDFLSNLVIGYIDNGSPIIAILEMKDNTDFQYLHSVVISGYKYNNEKNKIVELYVHDDNIGPYSKVTFKEKAILNWKNEWVLEWGYKEVIVKKLIIPLYHKIRLNFTKIYFNEIQELKNNPGLRECTIRTSLTDVNSYKEKLLREILPIAIYKEDAEKILTEQLPRFFWIIRIKYKEFPISDILFDATTNIKKRAIRINYIENIE